MPAKTSTRDIYEIVAALRDIADRLDDQAANLLSLPGGFKVHVDLWAPVGTGDDDTKRAAVDRIAEHVTGQPAAIAGPNATHGPYQSTLSEGCWRLRAVGYVRVPDPVEDLRAENERLRAQLAATQQPQHRDHECPCNDGDDENCTGH